MPPFQSFLLSRASANVVATRRLSETGHLWHNVRVECLPNAGCTLLALFICSYLSTEEERAACFPDFASCDERRGLTHVATGGARGRTSHVVIKSKLGPRWCSASGEPLAEPRLLEEDLPSPPTVRILVVRDPLQNWRSLRHKGFCGYCGGFLPALARADRLFGEALDHRRRRRHGNSSPSGASASRAPNARARHVSSSNNRSIAYDAVLFAEDMAYPQQMRRLLAQLLLPGDAPHAVRARERLYSSRSPSDENPQQYIRDVVCSSAEAGRCGHRGRHCPRGGVSLAQCLNEARTVLNRQLVAHNHDLGYRLFADGLSSAELKVNRSSTLTSAHVSDPNSLGNIHGIEPYAYRANLPWSSDADAIRSLQRARAARSSITASMYDTRSSPLMGWVLNVTAPRLVSHYAPLTWPPGCGIACDSQTPPLFLADKEMPPPPNVSRHQHHVEPLLFGPRCDGCVDSESRREAAHTHVDCMTNPLAGLNLTSIETRVRSQGTRRDATTAEHEIAAPWRNDRGHKSAPGINRQHSLHHNHPEPPWACAVVRQKKDDPPV